MTVPQATEHTFMQNHPAEIEGQAQISTSVDPASAQGATSFGDFDPTTIKVGPDAQNGDASPTSGDPLNPNVAKPAVGTDEWHKVRKDNHKEGKSEMRHSVPSAFAQSNMMQIVIIQLKCNG